MEPAQPEQLNSQGPSLNGQEGQQPGPLPANQTDAPKAPLQKVGQDPRYPAVPGGYIVRLRPNHTLAQHYTAVGRDMQPHVRGILDQIYKDRIVYTASGVDEELLDLIRMDAGVEHVKEESRGRWT
jgi:hypothetical protein